MIGPYPASPLGGPRKSENPACDYAGLSENKPKFRHSDIIATAYQCQSTTLPRIAVWTAGAFWQRARAGGWAYLIQDSHGSAEASGFLQCATVERAELMAIVHALGSLAGRSFVTLRTDSKAVLAIVQRELCVSSPAGRNVDLLIQAAPMLKTHRLNVELLQKRELSMEAIRVDWQANEAIRQGLKAQRLEGAA